MKKSVSVFILLLSTSTWVCCVLPILITLIAGAAAVGQLITVFPWLIPLTKYKLWTFLGIGALLIINFYCLYKSNMTPKECPIDKKEACTKGKKFSRLVFWISVVIYLVGVVVAYVLPFFMKMFDSNS